MAYCSNCGSELAPNAKACSNCGALIGGPAPVIKDWDHTADFEATDISDGKVYAICAYLLGFVGIVVALLAAKDSAYIKFHVKESIKLTLSILVVYVVSLILCWTLIVPIAGAILICILAVLKIIACVQVCQNKSIEPWIVRSLTFLK